MDCFAEGELSNILNEVSDNEFYIYEGGKVFEKKIKDDFSNILNASDIKMFKNMIDSTRASIEELKNDIDGHLKKINRLNDNSYYNNDCDLLAFRDYSRVKMASYINYSERILKKRKSVLKTLYDLCDELEKYVKDSDLESNSILGESLRTKNKKIVQVTISVQKIEWEKHNGSISWNFRVQSSKEINKVTFNVVPHSSFITEFGIAALYFFKPLDFPKYEVVSGTVRHTSSTLVRYLAVPTLTVIPKLWRGDIALQLQTGVSLANNQPVFHFGGGFRLFSLKNTTVTSISIMSGALFRFVKTPNTLLDKEATVETLNDDLRTKLQGPGFPYLGLQFNL